MYTLLNRLDVAAQCFNTDRTARTKYCKMQIRIYIYNDDDDDDDDDEKL